MSVRAGRRQVLFVVLGGLFGAAGNGWIGWCAYVAFTGGTLPIPAVEIAAPGGLRSGVVFLLFGVPIVSWVAYLAAMAVSVPLAFLVSVIAAAARRGKSGRR